MRKRITKHLITLKMFLKNAHIPFALVLEVLIGIMAIIGLLVLFLHLTSEVFEKDFAYFDMHIMRVVYALRNPLLTQDMIAISNFGEQGLILISFVFIGYTLVKKYYGETLLFSLTFVMGVIVNNILKFLYQRPRPTLHPLIHETNFSYPSGHAMNSFVFFTYLSYFVYRSTRNKKISIMFITICLFLIVLIGFSRIYLGVHYPSDVIAGYIAGLLWFCIVILLEKTLIFFRLFRKYRVKKK